MRVILAILLTVCVSFAQAAAVPAYTGKVNNSIGSIIQEKVGKLGFAANDPRFGATVSAVGTAATTVAAGVATGAVATVGWPALLVGAGVSAVVSGAVSLGLDGLVNWMWPDASHPDQTQLSGTGMGVGDPKNFSVMPASYAVVLDTYGPGADLWYASSTAYTSARHLRTAQVTCPDGGFYCRPNDTSLNSMGFDSTFSTPLSSSLSYNYWAYRWNRIVSSTTNPSTTTYQVVYDFVPPSGTTLLPPSYVSRWQAPGQSVNDLPQSYVTQPLSDRQLATIANALWRNAATANNPDAIPWSAANPITPADIAAWRAVNPQLVPTVNDFISPVTPPGSSVVPIPNPGTDGPVVVTPGVTPSSSDATSASLDWGQFQSPALEDTPTAQSILDPVFNLWPQWAEFAFPAHQSQCPTPQFTALNHIFTFDNMCQWVEMIRPAMQSAFALVWAVAVVFIVMGA